MCSNKIFVLDRQLEQAHSLSLEDDDTDEEATCGKVLYPSMKLPAYCVCIIMCMCVCMYVGMYVCMYECIYIIDP